MQAWVYDENGWPSGFVEGCLLKPGNYAQYLTYENGKVSIHDHKRHRALSFNFRGSWQDGKSPDFTDEYNLVNFGLDKIELKIY